MYIAMYETSLFVFMGILYYLQKYAHKNLNYTAVQTVKFFSVCLADIISDNNSIMINSIQLSKEI